LVVSERKPGDIDFESWVERQIRAATERGEFDNLPGRGKPIPGAGQPYDELWWVKDKLRRENASYLPPVLALRKEAEEARAAAPHAESETEARQLISEINKKILLALSRPPEGPPLNLRPFDADVVVREWRERHG
jgi:hypothetical protein